jgi:hypothetical protein
MMTRQSTDQLYIELDYFTPEEYYVYTAEAEVAITSQSTISCDAVKIVESAAEFTAEFTQTATISHIEGADLFAFSDAELAAVAARIRFFNLETLAAFDIATDYGLIKQGASTEAADFALAISAELSRGFDIAVSAAFSLTGDGDVIGAATEAAAELAAEFNCASVVNVIRDISADTSSQFDVNSDSNKITDSNTAIDCQFTQTAIVDKIAGYEINSNSQFQTDITAERIRGLDSAVSAVTEFSAVISHIHGADLIVDGFATLTADVTVEYFGAAAIAAASTVTASLTGIQNFSSAFVASTNIITSNYLGTGRPRHLTRFSGGHSTDIKKFGTASFTNGVVQTTNNSVLARTLFIANTDAIFLGAWVYITASTNQNILEHLNYFSFSINNGRLRFAQTVFLNNQATGQTSNAVETFPLNTWVHIALSVSATNISVYVNGSNVAGLPANAQRLYPWYGSTFSDIGLFRINPGSTVFVDDVIYYVGNNGGVVPSQSTITVPTAAYVNNINVSGLWHLDGDYLDDTSLLHIGSAALSSLTNLTAKLSGPVPAAAALSSQFTFAAAPGKNQELILLAFAESQVTAFVDIVKDAAAELTVTAEVVTDATRIQEAASAIDSTATVSSDLSVITDIEAEFNNTFALSTVVEITRDNAADLSTVIDITAAADRIRNADAALAVSSQVVAEAVKIIAIDSALVSTAELLAAANRSRDHALALTTDFVQTAQAEATLSLVSEQSAEFTVTAQGFRTAEIVLNGFSAALVLSDVERIRDHAAELQDQFTVFAQTANVIDFDIDPINAAASLDGSLDRIRFADCSLSSESLLDCSVLITRDFSSDLTTDSSVAIEVSRILTTDSNIYAASDLNGSLSVIRDAAINTSSTASMTVAGVTVIFGEGHLFADTTVTAQGFKTTEIVLTGFSAALVLTDVERIRDTAADVASAATTTANINVVQQLFSDMSAVTEVTAIAGVQANAAAALQANGFVLTTGREIRLDERVYIIPTESRIFKIASETRIRKVTGESRIYTIRSL